MAENLIYSAVTPEQHLIFLNTGKLIGVQNISVNSDFGSASINYIGIGTQAINQSLNSQQSADVTINSILINEDKFITLTGNSLCNIFLLKNKSNIADNYSLLSGCLNSYNFQCINNQPIQISANLTFYNNAGGMNTGTLQSDVLSQLKYIKTGNYNYLSSGIKISNGNTVSLTIDEYNTERIQEINFSVTLNHFPFYGIGNRIPYKINYIAPMPVKLNCSFEASKVFSGYRLKDFPLNKKTQNISIDVKDSSGVFTIHNYQFNNMTLISEQESASTEDNFLILRNYIGYL